MDVNIYPDEISGYATCDEPNDDEPDYRLRIGIGGGSDAEVVWHYRTANEYLLLHTMLTNALEVLLPPESALAPVAEARARINERRGDEAHAALEASYTEDDAGRPF